MDMKDQHFGIEIEFTGITREKAAAVAKEYFGETSRYVGGSYNAYEVFDYYARTWKFVSDASINAQKKVGREIQSATSEYSVELVSPICKWRDIETIQELVRRLRGAGAFSNKSCGIHIHVNASPFDAATLRNLTNIMYCKEDMIYKAMNVEVAREHRYCRKTDQRFLEELNRNKPRSLDEVSRIWYGGRDGSYNHYDDSRYHCLNLHSVFNKGTVEFRLFNSEIKHAGKIKAYIQFSLAVTAQALNQRGASMRKTQTTNEKYTFRTWLLRLGMIGDEFKSARLHLLEHLDGCIAWKDPQQAVAQRERLRAKREEMRAQESPAEPVQTEEQTQEIDEAAVDEPVHGLVMSL